MLSDLSGIIPVLALLTSIFAIWTSEKAERAARRDKATEMEWTLRGQTGDAVNKIADIRSSLRELDSQIRHSENSGHADQADILRSRRTILHGQMHAMGRHASYLLNQGKTSLVSDQEYAIVASALDADPDAGEYWRKAVSSAKGYRKAVHQGGYAKFTRSTSGGGVQAAVPTENSILKKNT